MVGADLFCRVVCNKNARRSTSRPPAEEVKQKQGALQVLPGLQASGRNLETERGESKCHPTPQTPRRPALKSP